MKNKTKEKEKEKKNKKAAFWRLRIPSHIRYKDNFIFKVYIPKQKRIEFII